MATCHRAAGSVLSSVNSHTKGIHTLCAQSGPGPRVRACAPCPGRLQVTAGPSWVCSAAGGAPSVRQAAGPRMAQLDRSGARAPRGGRASGGCGLLAPSQASEGPSPEDRAPPICSHLHKEPREGWGHPGSGSPPMPPGGMWEAVGLRFTAPAPEPLSLNSQMKRCRPPVAPGPERHPCTERLRVSPLSGAHGRQLTVSLSLKTSVTSSSGDDGRTCTGSADGRSRF